MILVDTAVGSKDLVAPLEKLGLPVVGTHLDSGDVSFIGRGIGGAPLSIGIEIKTIGELVGSLQTERLQGHQLLKMIEHFDRSYLIVEGDFGQDKQGKGLFKRKGSPPMPGASSAVQLEQRLFNLQTRGGLITRHVGNRRDTLRVVQAWYRYWDDRNLDEHKSHLAVYAPDLDSKLKEGVSEFRAFVAGIPGIGLEVSGVVESYFSADMDQLMEAPAAEWAEICTTHKGKQRRLGEKKAAKVYKFLHPGRKA